ARKCGEDPEQVFKTLVTQGNDKNFYVFVVPVENELDLKACARSVGVKSVEMIHVRDLLKTTGYIRGGCSPIGMKKKYTTVYDETIVLFDTVLVSGGRIGTQVEIAPSDLIRITDGITADISRS
ncbi:MAG: Cys-tRNA(Pro) deacylase, partial [Erysipelotrichaceae bacterium]|nr:Cys-tRNA(Pro) deacylase [Erysipelotrichaceae bacterium]